MMSGQRCVGFKCLQFTGKLQYDYSKCIKVELHKRATLSRDYKPRKSIATILQYVPTELNINNAAVRLLYIL